MATPDPDRDRRKDRRALLPAAATVLAAFITAIGAVLGALVAAHSPTVSQALGGSPEVTIIPTVTVTRIFTIPGSPSPTQTETSGSPFLVDLNPVYGSSVQTGFARIGGTAFRKSFLAGLCYGDSGASIRVSIPAGFTGIEGSVGYDNDSFDKSGTDSSGPLNAMQIEQTSDPTTVDDPTWSLVDTITLPAGGKKAVPFNETFSPNATQVLLTPKGYACSTTVDWGDPKFH